MTDTLRKLHEAATPGEWKVFNDQVYVGEDVFSDHQIAHILSSPFSEYVPGVGSNACDAELIAYLRNHTAYFIALIEAARGLNSVQIDDRDPADAKYVALREALKPFGDGNG